jgi:hypothetical protein
LSKREKGASRAGAREAGDRGLGDLAEQSEALRQQVAAARNKLGLLRKTFLAKLDDPSKLN